MKITSDAELQNLRDEEYLIFRAKEGQSNPFHAKSWLITAQTIFPKDFGIQFEIYKIAKQENNISESSKCLCSLFNNFPNEPVLWAEIDIIMALLSEASSENVTPTSFMAKIFFALPKESQKNIILSAVQRSKDDMNYVSLMLLLTTSFPENTADNGLPLVNALMKAEKNAKDALNPFRKKLVCELLPRFLQAEGLEVRPKLLHLLLTKAIEFYFAYSTESLNVAIAKLELESALEDPGQDLFTIVRLIGWNLGWELASEFDVVSNRELILQRVQSAVEGGARLGGRKGDNCEDVREVFFVTVTLFFHALLEYMRRLMPNLGREDSSSSSCSHPLMTLVEAFRSSEKDDACPESITGLGGSTPRGLLSPPTHKRLRPSIDEEDGSPAVITVSKLSQGLNMGSGSGDLVGCPQLGSQGSLGSTVSSGAISLSLITAIKCWNLLHAYESLQIEFERFAEELQINKWLAMFRLDVCIYEGRLIEAESEIRLALSRSNPPGETPLQSNLVLNLKLASVLFALNKYSAAAEACFQIVEDLSSHGPWGALTPNLTVPSTPSRRHLHILALTPSQSLQFVVTLLIHSLSNLALVEGNKSDSCLGHLVVLLQYEWPRHCSIFKEIMDIIRKKKGFSFMNFSMYVTTADILEEFMFISNSYSIALDILPLQNNTKPQQRMSTRGADRDSKMDFKIAMKKQMQRCFESVETNILAYLLRYGSHILNVFL